MNVLISGAGPAGAGLALLLARRGIDVVLIERESHFERVFRGEGLMPSGVDALFEMRLDGLLASLPGRKLESWDMYIQGDFIFRAREPLDELGDRAVRVIPQPMFLEAVVKEASQHASFRFERGATLRDLVREGDRIVGARVQTPNASGSGSRELRCDLVVGCDGRASAIRKRAGLELRLLPEAYDVLWFKLPAPERLREGCSMLLLASSKGMGACYTSWDGRLQFALTLPKGGYREARHTRASDWAEAIAGPCPEWLADHMRAVRDEIEGPVLLDVIVGRCTQWSAPGLLLLGDAAHPMSPIRAQGINLALRDAIVAANHLVPLAQRDALSAELQSEIDRATTAVQAEREPEIVRAQTLQHRDAAGWDSWYAPLAMGLARRVGPLLGRYRWAERAWLSQQRDLRFGSTDVKLRV